jgi:hypothetical protein
MLCAFLRNPKVPTHRKDLYILLLGHCGKPEHAQTVLEQTMDENGQLQITLLTNAFIATVLLQPGQGWVSTKEALRHGGNDFITRFSALRALRFFLEERKDVISRTDLMVALESALRQEDMADFAIEEYRKWQRWEYTDRVLKLFDKGPNNVTRRAILRFALCCPDPRAAAFVQRLRREDAEWVREMEELLELESGGESRK